MYISNIYNSHSTLSPLLLTKNIKTNKSNISISHSIPSPLLLTKTLKHIKATSILVILLYLNPYLLKHLDIKSNIYNSHSTHTFMNANTQFMLRTL